MRESLRDRFASWLCSRHIVWKLAEAGFMSARLTPLCIARCFGVPVRWAHLTGRASINTVSGAAECEVCRHA